MYHAWYCYLFTSSIHMLASPRHLLCLWRICWLGCHNSHLCHRLPFIDRTAKDTRKAEQNGNHPCDSTHISLPLVILILIRPLCGNNWCWCHHVSRNHWYILLLHWCCTLSWISHGTLSRCGIFARFDVSQNLASLQLCCTQLLSQV